MAKKDTERQETDREKIDRMAREAGHGTESRGGFNTPPEHKAGVPQPPKDQPPAPE